MILILDLPISLRLSSPLLQQAHTYWSFLLSQKLSRTGFLSLGLVSAFLHKAQTFSFGFKRSLPDRAGRKSVSLGEDLRTRGPLCQVEGRLLCYYLAMAPKPKPPPDLTTICPICGKLLYQVKCKLVCEKPCNYYMSCGDYL